MKHRLKIKMKNYGVCLNILSFLHVLQCIFWNVYKAKHAINDFVGSVDVPQLLRAHPRCRCWVLSSPRNDAGSENLGIGRAVQRSRQCSGDQKFFIRWTILRMIHCKIRIFGICWKILLNSLCYRIVILSRGIDARSRIIVFSGRFLIVSSFSKYGVHLSDPFRTVLLVCPFRFKDRTSRSVSEQAEAAAARFAQQVVFDLGSLKSHRMQHDWSPKSLGLFKFKVICHFPGYCKSSEISVGLAPWL